MKPARAQALKPQDGDEVLCDLDAIHSNRVTFVFRGETHVLRPIDTQSFFGFWKAVNDFHALEHRDPQAVNAAYLKIIQQVCDTIRPDHVASMSILQKSNLLQHIVGKVSGSRQLLDAGAAEKKTPMSPKTRPVA